MCLTNDNFLDSRYIKMCNKRHFRENFCYKDVTWPDANHSIWETGKVLNEIADVSYK